MKVLIYGINYAPELTGIGKYSGEMGAWMAGRDHEVRVVTAPPYYPDWAIQDGFCNKYSREYHGRLSVYRCPLYVPAEPSTLKRLLHLISFALSSLLVLGRLLFWRPQVVILVEPTLFCAPGALLYARLTGAKAILHIQDYEVDAMFGLGMATKSGWLSRLAHAVDGWLMRRFDRVSTISRSMIRNAVDKGVAQDKLVFFPNWVDTRFISPAADGSLFRRKWGIADRVRVVLYSGNMGRKQGLEIVVEAAAKLRNEQDLLFVMVGEGAARRELEEQALALGLQNMRFEPLQAYADLPALLRLADLHLVVQRRGAADVVLPSKLTGILSAGGHALMTSEAGTELALLVDMYPGIARCIPPEDLDAFCAALQQFLVESLPPVNQTARDYALQYLDRDAVLEKFDLELQRLHAVGQP